MKKKKTKENPGEIKMRHLRNATTNAKMDSHKRFCRRCHSFNNGCPNPGGPKNCSL